MLRSGRKLARAPAPGKSPKRISAAKPARGRSARRALRRAARRAVGGSTGAVDRRPVTEDAAVQAPDAPSPGAPPPDFLDEYVHWELADATAICGLVHTQPVSAAPAPALALLDRLDELGSRSVSPAFSALSALSDRFQDSLPEQLPPLEAAAHVPKNPPFQLQELIEVASHIAEPSQHPKPRAMRVPRAAARSPRDSFVSYISHKLSRYCGYLAADSHYHDKLRLQEITYRFSKTDFRR
ncbi:LAQU0S11e03180g1_1 [Lachancea quebecensis]|uniref:LAQU0S11e03180g1_1 n=1 Tax=Lachancea quebecensis TaxID=1654605 RepID=A0A0P1KV11_9SACH|nr:LAQU0S11e03180g1_1 [Lachancea quebecensis]